MKDEYIVGQEIKELVEGTSNALREMMTPVELPPEITDAQIKKAILDISPERFEGMMARLEQRGIPRQEVINFLQDFSESRRW